MQGDCLSAILFIYYLSCALIHEPYDIPSSLCPPKCHTDDLCTCEIQEHAHTAGEKPYIHHDTRGKTPIPDINPKYADDITYITTSLQRHQNRERITTERLKPYNLMVNGTKTENYIAPDIATTTPEQQPIRNTLWSDLDWLIPTKTPPTKTPPQKVLDCKLLGSKTGTEQDIRNRKCKAIPAMTSNEKYFRSKFISKDMKIRIFNTYVQPIVLFNSEIWNMNNTLNNSIDAYQRRLLRQALNIKHPQHIRNEKLYEITKAVPWSITIKRRRLNLLGHILRLAPETPVQTALQANTIPDKKQRGRPKNTWIRTVLNDLKPELKIVKLELTEHLLNTLKELAADREVWRDIVKRSMSSTQCKNACA